MKSLPPIGTVAETRWVVEPTQAIEFADGGMPAVLSTPSLIAVLERTARQLVAPHLEPDERTVGGEIELKHLAPTPVGQTVVATARVIQVIPPFVTFQVEARNEQELVARGVHKRAVIRVDAFGRRVCRKAG